MMNGSPDIGKTKESTVVTKTQESTDSATQESSGVARVPDKMGPSGTEISKTSIESAGSGKATVAVEIPGSSGMETTQNVVGPSRTEISTALINTAESGESSGVEKIQEPLRMATVQNLEGPEQDMKTTETTGDPQSVGSQMHAESVPLNSQTGALLPVQDPSLTPPSYPQWFWSLLSYYPSQIRWFFCSWFSDPASQTQDDETGKNLSNPKTGDAGSNDDVGTNDDTFEVLDVPGVSASNEHVAKGKSFKENIDKIEEIIQSTFWAYLGYLQTFQKRHTVGIFSRSSESEYEWLTSQLRSPPFHSTVSTVRPHYISNTGRLQFMEAVFQCTFGILYHTRNRGRINIVDVTDSLYDEELKYMSQHLGKGNVIVVVDDLEDTSDEERTRILDTQPSIRELAKDILLFNETEKKAVTTEEVPQEP